MKDYRDMLSSLKDKVVDVAGKATVAVTDVAGKAVSDEMRDKVAGAAHTVSERAKYASRMTRLTVDCNAELERIKRTYSTTGGNESDVLKIYKTVPLLVIDDIGKEPPTEWAISTVYNIINGRYEAYLPTIVTTNYDTEALIDRMTPRESHDSMTARATIDRLMEMCRGITLTGQSWRSR